MAELRNMSANDLVEAYDRDAQTTQVGTGFWREELARRDAMALSEQVAQNTAEVAESGERMEGLSEQAVRLTKVNLGLTTLSVIAAIVAVGIALSGCGRDSNEGGSQPNSSISSAQVVEEFRSAGLEVGKATKMTREDFGLAPLTTDDATRFLIPSLGDDSGGRAFAFDDTGDLEDTKAYYDKLGEGSAAFFSHTFANEDAGVLVQINGELPDPQAQKYESVVGQLGSR